MTTRKESAEETGDKIFPRRENVSFFRVSDFFFFFRYIRDFFLCFFNSTLTHKREEERARERQKFL